MKADYLNFQQAAARCVLGAIIQAALCLLLLIYGTKSGDHAAITAACMTGLGLIVWISLAIVFDQKRRERVEALEQEALTATSGGSVFEKGADFRVAARRLELLQKFFLPSASLVFGGLMILVGWWRFSSGKRLIDPANWQEVTQTGHGWGIPIGIACGLIGFAFARYIAGMARRPVWQLIRAGAGQAVAVSLVGLAMVIGHFVDVYGPDIVLRYLSVALPIFMMILGVEVGLLFLLDLYRPRKAGEERPAACDSRLLSFVAAPDRIAESLSEAINYQFGYDVSSTWLYQLMARSVPWLVMFGLGGIWIATCVVVLQPDQRGLVLRSGEFSREIGPGMSFKLPWPFETVSLPRHVEKDAKGNLIELGETVTGVRTLQLATPPPNTDSIKALLWTNDHSAGEVFYIVKPSPVAGGTTAEGKGDAAWLSDIAMIAMEIPMQYAVKDLHAFELLGDTMQRDELLRAAAQRVVSRTMRTYTVDDILGPGRTEIAPRLKHEIQAAFDALNVGSNGKSVGAGVEVLSVAVNGVHPSKAVAPSFEKVVQAEQGAEGLLEKSMADATETLTKAAGQEALAKEIVAAIEERDRLIATSAPPEAQKAQAEKIQTLLGKAGGIVATTLAEAKGSRWAKHMGDRARATRYAGMVTSFEANEELFRAHMYFEALASALGAGRLYITDDSRSMWVTWEGQIKDVSSYNFKELSSDGK